MPSPPPCVSGALSTACPEKCWKLGVAPGGGPVFPVSHRVPCSPVQACTFVNDEPEQVLSILTTSTGAGQVRACKGGAHWLGAWGRRVHAYVYTEQRVDQGDPSSQAVMNLDSRARHPWVSSLIFPIPGSVTLNPEQTA